MAMMAMIRSCAERLLRGLAPKLRRERLVGALPLGFELRALQVHPGAVPVERLLERGNDDAGQAGFETASRLAGRGAAPASGLAGGAACPSSARARRPCRSRASTPRSPFPPAYGAAAADASPAAPPPSCAQGGSSASERGQFARGQRAERYCR